MDMKKRSTAFLAIFLTLVLSSNFISGCKPPPLSSKEQAFADIIPVPYHELNTILRLNTPPGMNDYKFGNSIGFELLNESRVPISLPPDRGIKLYTYDEITEKWVGINNIGVYLPIGNAEILPASNYGTGVPNTAVYPDIQDFSKPITIRILMVGELADEESSNAGLVGAYIDVTLVP
jgi:hypothetical protein